MTLGFAESRSFSRELVRRGPYRYSRNPQYVGAPPAYFGWAIACNSQLVLIVAALGSVALLLQPFVEEPWLRKRFGAQYDAYAREVPRFLPHLAGGSGRDERV